MIEGEIHGEAQANAFSSRWKDFSVSLSVELVCEGLDEIQLRPIVTRSCYQPMTVQRATLSKKMGAVTCLVTNGCRHKIFFTLHSGLGSEDQGRKGMKAIIMNLSVNTCPHRGVWRSSEKPHSVSQKIQGAAGWSHCAGQAGSLYQH